MAFVLLIILPALSFAESSEVYQWTDADGIKHFGYQLPDNEEIEQEIKVKEFTGSDSSDFNERFEAEREKREAESQRKAAEWEVERTKNQAELEAKLEKIDAEFEAKRIKEQAKREKWKAELEAGRQKMEAELEKRQQSDTRKRDKYLSDPNISTNIKKAIRHYALCIGMTKEQVYLSWGVPNKTNRSVYASGVHEQLIYKNKGYVYMQNEKLTSWQEQ